MSAYGVVCCYETMVIFWHIYLFYTRLAMSCVFYFWQLFFNCMRPWHGLLEGYLLYGIGIISISLLIIVSVWLTDYFYDTGLFYTSVEYNAIATAIKLVILSEAFLFFSCFWTYMDARLINHYVQYTAQFMLFAIPWLPKGRFMLWILLYQRC